MSNEKQLVVGIHYDPESDDPALRRPVWYLPGAPWRYVEDVKKLAAAAGLKIIDAEMTVDRSGEHPNPPKVTLRPEFAPPKTAEASKPKA